MKFTDIKDLSAIEINKKLREIKGQLFEAKMKNVMGQMTNPMSIRHMRRDIARLNTALTTKIKGN